MHSIAASDGEPLLRRRCNGREFIASGGGGDELPLRTGPFVEELAHVGDEIANHGQIRERRDLETPISRNRLDVSAAGPARAAVDSHCARAAHADAARETVGERRIDAPLNVRDDVEDGLRRLARHLVGDEAGVEGPAAAPHANGKHVHRRSGLARVIVPAANRTSVAQWDDDYRQAKGDGLAQR